MADTGICIGAGEGGANPQVLELKRANRHGLIAGATGTGKTVTLQGIGPITPDERKVMIGTDAIGAKYDTVADRQSADELLAAKLQEAAAAQARADVQAAANNPWDRMATSAARSASSAIGRQVANQIGREVFGSARSSGIVGGLVRGVPGGLFRGR